MKFDVVLTNPPYNKDLHLQILNELTKISNKVVCVHPARWVEDILAKYKGKNATGKKYEHLKKMLTKVMMIKQKDGCKMFDIGLPQDMMIGVYENGKDNNGVLPIYNDPNMFFNILEKILEYAHNMKSIGDMVEKNQIDGVRLEVYTQRPIKLGSETEYYRTRNARIIGKFSFNNGYTKNGEFWASAGKVNQGGHDKSKGTPIPMSLKFNSFDESDIFKDLYFSNTVQNIMHMLKYGESFELTHIPYFDPKVIKTEDDVLDALGITDETHRQWMKRDVYDYREKDFIKYGEWIDC